MEIIHVAAEMAPLAKVGGLGDVLQGLPPALNKVVKCSVVLPKYGSIPTKFLKEAKIFSQELPVYEMGIFRQNRVWLWEENGVEVFLIDPVENNYFHREKIYGYSDDLERFIYFSRAALEFAATYKPQISILHIHDWHTALIAPMQKELFKDKLPNLKKIVLSIHNLEHQGKCPPVALEAVGMDPNRQLAKEAMLDPDPLSSKTLNLLKGGIVYSNHIVTVSPTYAEEILSPPLGFHLDPLLRSKKDKLIGILNGIDEDAWDPSKDDHLPENYSREDSLEKMMKAKRKCKEKLYHHFGLEKNFDLPLVSSITRLVPQKGPDLIEHAMFRTLRKKGMFVLLGSSPIEEIERHFYRLQKFLKNAKRAFLDFQYNEELSRLIFAASDFLIVPSLFEPCGLTQLIAFRYGVLPIARQTGGLKDSVFDVEYSDKPKESRNGYTFKEFSTKGVDSALERALNTFVKDRDFIYGVQHQNMQIDHSWKVSAEKYLQLYEE